MVELGPICGDNSSNQDAVMREILDIQLLMGLLQVNNDDDRIAGFESKLWRRTHILELLR